ncbi:hypothetical protein GWM83_03090, partial [Candidatus Bathyarchaeota archaeon]|nr:hypothetical protein [Candidatus Bathyarchaeota archaeon]
MRLAVEAKDVVSLSAMPRLISYYIFKEMAAPFLLSVAVLTITMLLGRVLTILELYLTHGLDARFVFGFLVSA